MGKFEDDAATRLAHGSAHDAERHQAAAHRHRAIGELLHGPKSRRIVGWSVAVIVVLAASLTALFAFTDLEWRDVLKLVDWSDYTRAIARLNPAAIIPLMAILPVFGFPVSVVYLIAGARFGPLWGGVVVAFATAVHLLASYGIARSFLRQPLARFIERRHKRLPEIPEDEQAMVSLIVALVPGVPYVIRIYLLALAGFRFRIYFWVCLVVCVVRSYVTILLGDLSSEPSGRRLLILLGFDGLKIVICGLVIWWLRVHHRRYHGAAAAAPASAAKH